MKFPMILRDAADGGGGGGGGQQAAADGGAPQAAADGAAQQAAAAAATTWTDGLDPGLKQLATAKAWASPADAVKAAAELEALIGETRIALPKADAKPEDIAKFYQALGRPEAPDKYDLAGFKPPDGLPWNGDVQTAMLGEMHKAGLNSAQVKALLGSYATRQHQVFQDFQARAQQAAQTGETELKRDWGAAFEAKRDAANYAAQKIFGADLEAARQLRLASGIAVLDDPRMARALAQVGEMMSEPNELVGRGGGGREGGTPTTPAAAKAEIKRILGEAAENPKHPYLDKAHPEYRAMQTRMRGLYELSDGGGFITD